MHSERFNPPLKPALRGNGGVRFRLNFRIWFSVQAGAIVACNPMPSAQMTQWLYLPVTTRQDWVAAPDRQGQIQGFLRGDGF
jgi:hypothetical protein